MHKQRFSMVRVVLIARFVLVVKLILMMLIKFQKIAKHARKKRTGVAGFEPAKAGSGSRCRILEPVLEAVPNARQHAL